MQTGRSWQRATLVHISRWMMAVALVAAISSVARAADDPRAGSGGRAATHRRSVLLLQSVGTSTPAPRRRDGAALGGARRRPRHRRCADPRRRERRGRNARRPAGLRRGRERQRGHARRLLDAGPMQQHRCRRRHAVDGGGARRETRRGAPAARAGAKVNAAEPEVGQTALMWAVARTARVMTLLLSRGRHGRRADARRRQARGAPAGRRRRIARRRHRAQRRAAAGRAAPDARRHDATALRRARRLLDAARLLVEAGADVNAADPNGITPLLMAITNGQLPVARCWSRAARI